MKVVHSSDELELKLNVTAVNCKHRSYNNIDPTTVTTVTNTTVDKVCDQFRHDF